MNKLLGAISDVGNKRDINEDYLSYYEEEKVKIYVIADGMGGHNAGEIASKMAVEKTIEYIKSNIDIDDLARSLKAAITYANSEVYSYSKEKEDLKGMGTTITACITDGNMYIIGNVGDSGCYAIKKNRMFKITKDHSLVQQLVDEGSITEEEARNHPNKNIITRSLGTYSDVKVDIFQIGTGEADKILLCTDGLTNELTFDEISYLISENENNLQACRALVELAKERGGRDNITVMVIGGVCDNDWNHIE